MAFDLAADMTNVFLDSGFEEEITYTPSGGAAQTIKAIVDRGDSKQLRVRTRPGPELGTRSYKIEIWIAVNDIAAVTINVDKVTLAARIGDSSDRNYIVKAIISQDVGGFHLGLGN